jgi:16S rRNA processing protein RimM
MTFPARAPGRVLIGRVLKPHGVRGLVRIESYMSEPEAIASLQALQDETGRPVRFSLEGAVRGRFIARIEGVTTREAAEALAGRALFVPRATLPDPGEDALYEGDLVGLAVREGATTRGKVVRVADFGAGPLLEVEPVGSGETVYVPFTDDVVKDIDLEARVVTVDLPRGLWPED